MPARHALLIGVERCDDDSLFPPIPKSVIEHDITAMRDALRESGYGVIKVLGVPPREAGTEELLYDLASRGRCQVAISNACKEVPAGGVLLLYFSGHGVRHDGRDYLVPADYASTEAGVPDPRGLISLDLRGYTEGCAARVGVFFVDACRNDPSTSIGQAARSIEVLQNGVFVVVTGCGPGETCRYDETAGSAFTEVLAAALQPRHRARTVPEVFQATRSALRGRGQEPSARLGSDLQHQGALDEPICDSVRTLEKWRDAVADSPLWRMCHPDDAAAAEQVKAQVFALVERHAAVFSDEQENLATTGVQDPWTDPEYPVRVLSAMYAVLDGAEPVLLRARELGPFVLAPFLREAVLASGLTDVRGVNPRAVRPTFEPGHRFDLEMVHVAYDQLCRRVAQLRDDAASRDAVAMWMVHRWLLGRADIWRQRVVIEWCETAAGAILPAAGAAVAGESAEYADLVRMLAQSVGSAPVSDEPAGSTVEARRLRALRRLASLAGVMAADPRRVSQVIPDHIGVADPVSMTELQNVLKTHQWVRTGSSLELRAVCKHPAVHAALQDLAGVADDLRRRLVGANLDDPDGVLRNLPESFTAASVRPLVRHGQSAYQVPLLRFRLAADKVQTLLMGSQLYGDPTVAIRELYQNALDACRYRHMRMRWRWRGAPDPPSTWSGHIVFRQGRDSTGRTYIECEDNGVGMAEDVITDVFAEAGTRFIQTEAFRHEQARWQEHDGDLRLYPVSQFGIGVFSYFMLATEISIVTVSTDDEGLRDGTPLEISIAGDGNLFRIRPATDVPAHIYEGGTRVRLTLTPDRQVSCVEALRRHLVVAEYPVQVHEDGAPAVSWTPGELFPDSRRIGSVRATDHVWWTLDEACFLADGIRVVPSHRTPPLHMRGREPFAFVLNMTGRHRPRLSVDRRELLEWDTEWAAEQLKAAVPTLRWWSGTTMHWLWQLASADPQLADAVYAELSDMDLAIRPSEPDRTVRLGEIGCYPEDNALQPDRDQWSDRLPSTMPRWIRPWRYRLWRQTLTAAGPAAPEAVPDDVTGYPVIRPSDVPLLARPVVDLALLRRLPEYRDLTTEELLRRLRPFAIAGLDLRSARGALEPVEDRRAGDDLRSDLASGELDTGALLVRTVRHAATTGHNLGEVSQQMRRLVPEDAGVAALAANVAADPALTDYVPDLIDVRLLNRDLRDSRIGLAGLSLNHLRRAAEMLRTGVQDVAQRAARWRPLGVWSAADRDWTDVVWPAGDRVVGFLLNIDHQPTVIDLIALAAECEEPVGAVRDRLAALVRAAGLTVELPDVPASWEAARPDPLDVFLLTNSRFVDGRDPAARLATIVNAVAARLRTGAEHLLRAAVDRVAPLWQLPVQVPAPMLVAVAYEAQGAIRTVRLILEKYLVPDGQLAEIDHSCDDRNPAYDQVWPLLDRRPDGVAWRMPDPLSLAWQAHRQGKTVRMVLDDLLPYRALGALLPEDGGGPTDFVPDAYDVRALAADVPAEDAPHGPRSPWLPLPDSEVTPQHLVRVAGRYGWTLPRTYDRLIRFTPIGLRIQFERGACPDGPVHWPDLIALSEELDGWDPPLAGEVDAARVARAAAAIGEPANDTKQRLARFQTLFQYRVSTEEPDDDHPPS